MGKSLLIDMQTKGFCFQMMQMRVVNKGSMEDKQKPKLVLKD